MGLLEGSLDRLLASPKLPAGAAGRRYLHQANAVGTAPSGYKRQNFMTDFSPGGVHTGIPSSREVSSPLTVTVKHRIGLNYKFFREHSSQGWGQYKKGKLVLYSQLLRGP